MSPTRCPVAAITFPARDETRSGHTCGQFRAEQRVSGRRSAAWRTLRLVKHRLARVLLCLLVAACSSSEDNDSSGSGAGTGSASSNESCPSNVYPGIPCDGDQLELSCAGVASCFCGSEGVTVETTCVCTESASLGRAWHCGDECEQSCGAGGAGASGSGGAGGSPDVLGCSDWCAHFATAPCVRSIRRDCESDCEDFFGKPGCEAEFQAYLQCWVAAPLGCDGQLVTVEGCDAETAALQACLG